MEIIKRPANQSYEVIKFAMDSIPLEALTLVAMTIAR